MRCFIALPLPSQAVAAIARAAEGLREALGGLAWTKPAGYHLTLAFLGEQEAAGIEAARRALASLGNQPAFRVLPAGLGRLPRYGPGRVLVMDFAEGGLEVAALRSSLGKALDTESEKAGIPALDPDWDGAGGKAKRPYVAHLTLARARDAVGRRKPGALPALDPALVENFRAAIAVVCPQGGWPIEAALLYKSELRRSGAVYTEVDRASLRNAAAEG